MSREWFDPRELLAQLNTRTAQLGDKSRDTPRFPAEAIAGALGMVHHKLGRELLCHLHWRDGAALSEDALHGLIRAECQRENEVRAALLSEARLELICAEDEWSTRRSHTKEDHARMDQLRARVLHHKGKQWPNDQAAHFHQLRRGVLAEMASAKLCPNCEGRGHSMGHAKAQGFIADQKMCTACAGSGREPMSDRRRAELIQRDESSYRKSWQRMYAWTFHLCSHAETTAARQLWHALTWREPTEPTPDNPHVVVEFTGFWPGTEFDRGEKAA